MEGHRRTIGSGLAYMGIIPHGSGGENHAPVEGGPSRCTEYGSSNNAHELHGAFGQARSGTGVDEGTLERVNSAGGGRTHVQARGEVFQNDETHGAIHGRQEFDGRSITNRQSHSNTIGGHCMTHATVSNMWPRRTTAIPTPEEMEWPINAVRVTLAATQRIIMTAHARGDTRLSTLWTSLHEIEEPLVSETKSSENKGIRIGDIHDMIEADIMSKVQKTKRATATLKAVSEKKKRRRRCLLWPRMFNKTYCVEGAPYEPDLPAMSTPEQVIQQVTSAEYGSSTWIAIVYDIKSAFFQHQVPAGFSDWCVIDWGGERYSFNRLPMGSTVSPEIQQRISVFLLEEALRAVSGAEDSVRTIVHIDNFRFFGQAELVTKVAAAFEATRAEYDVTLNPREVGSGDFLGINFCYEDQSVALAHSFCEKLIQLDWSRKTTVENILSIFGKLFFAATVLQLHLDGFYYGIKFYRKTSHMLAKNFIHLDSELTWWRDALSDAQRWASDALQNQRRYHIERAVASGTLFTDASDVGFGMMYFPFRGPPIACGESWATTVHRPWFDPTWLPHINQRETITIELGATWMKQIGVKPQDTHLRVDNMTARKAIIVGRHNSFFINQSVQRGRVNCPHGWKSAEYVNTKNNHSDLPSREPEKFPNMDGTMKANGQLRRSPVA